MVSEKKMCPLAAVKRMSTIVQIVTWELYCFLLGLFGVVAAQLLSGQISTQNLLRGRRNDTGKIERHEGERVFRRTEDSLYFSPERVQLLLATLSAGLYYLTLVTKNGHPGTLPPVPDTWLQLLGGSNAIYLGGKAYMRFFRGNNQ